MKLVLTGAPKSTNTIYRSTTAGGFHRRYMSADGKAIKESYQYQAQAQHNGEITTLPVKVTAVLFFGDKRIRDIDNHNKLWMDALSGIVWEDDKQVMELTVRKDYDKENPRIELNVTILKSSRD